MPSRGLGNRRFGGIDPRGGVRVPRRRRRHWAPRRRARLGSTIRSPSRGDWFVAATAGSSGAGRSGRPGRSTPRRAGGGRRKRRRPAAPRRPGERGQRRGDHHRLRRRHRLPRPGPRRPRARRFESEPTQSTVDHWPRCFGVANRDAWSTVWRRPIASFRRSSAYRSDPGAVIAWLRIAQLDSHHIAAAPYSTIAFRKALRQVRALTRGGKHQRSGNHLRRGRCCRRVRPRSRRLPHQRRHLMGWPHPSGYCAQRPLEERRPILVLVLP